MKVKLISVTIISMILLSACVVRPAHHGKRIKVKVPVRTVLVLEQEHSGHNVLVVNVKPAKKRNCWKHKKHWHCNR